MPLTRHAADPFCVVTVILVSFFIALGLFCISYSAYFRYHIRKQGLLQLGYFNGPWVTRIAFILIAIWWCIGEIVRLSFLKGSGRLFSSPTWQKNVCKYYILSNIGLAEPNLYVMLLFLLQASLKKRELGPLSPRWNGRTVRWALLLSLPMFILQLFLVFFGSKLFNKEGDDDPKLANYFWSTSALTEDGSTCTYPLLSTALLGLYDIILIGHVSYFGTKIVSLAINKGLQKRVYILVFSAILLVTLRVILLGFTVLPRPASFTFEALTFLGFLMLLIFVSVGTCVLVYCPIADALALRRVVHFNIEELPFDDYYHDGASLITNQSQLEMMSRNSDASTKRGSISFRTMIKDESPGADVSENIGQFCLPSLHIVSPPGSPLFPGRSMVPHRQAL
ncbi:unnamed protein product [Spirodela intermedia]|uniref:Uncharacterized protein n=2 Tax=Spirodela intermedia TaxID=51605 RepID=A0A7I8JDA4_SPIIN|nr:unnamed protein product [Spirodela intermedia]CAA6668147.1 unnamed protein product [Spirodela intermedia]CAA7404980.1 unnamed protein product [Spirodela intermedia]